MTLSQTNKFVWIVETIYRAHKISFLNSHSNRKDVIRALDTFVV